MRWEWELQYSLTVDEALSGMPSDVRESIEAMLDARFEECRRRDEPAAPHDAEHLEIVTDFDRAYVALLVYFVTRVEATKHGYFQVIAVEVRR